LAIILDVNTGKPQGTKEVFEHLIKGLGEGCLLPTTSEYEGAGLKLLDLTDKSHPIVCDVHSLLKEMTPEVLTMIDNLGNDKHCIF